MPESALSGLVEGLLQGNALKEKRKQDAYEKERQHATDIFQQHVQTWKEQQSQADAQRVAAQQTFDNNIATQKQALAEKDEQRKADADKLKTDLAKALASAKDTAGRFKAYQDFIDKGGYLPESASALSGYTPSAAAPAPQIGGGAGSALDILNSAGQNQRPLPGGAPGGLVPAAIQSLMGTPPGTQMPPAATGPRATSPIGQAPAVASKIATQKAQADAAVARAAKLTTDQANEMSMIGYREALKKHTEEMDKLTQAKVKLTNVQAETQAELGKLKPSLMQAVIDLTNARGITEATRREYMKNQMQHTKFIDELKASEKDLNDEAKRGNIFKTATSVENYFTKERFVQEKAQGNNIAKLKGYQSILDKLKEDQLTTNGDKVSLRNAQLMKPKVEQDIKDTQRRIDDLAAREAFAHKYVARTTKILNVDGSVNEPLTADTTETADQLAADAEKASEEADAAAHAAGLVPTPVTPPAGLAKPAKSTGSHFLDTPSASPSTSGTLPGWLTGARSTPANVSAAGVDAAKSEYMSLKSQVDALLKQDTTNPENNRKLTYAIKSMNAAQKKYRDLQKKTPAAKPSKDNPLGLRLPGG